MRLSYLCDCAGERPIGRELDNTVHAARTRITDFTGAEPVTCPWRSIQHPLVRETMQAMRFHENGNLALAYPNPSHRLIEAIGYWSTVVNRCTSKHTELERQNRDKAPPAPSGGPRRGPHG